MVCWQHTKGHLHRRSNRPTLNWLSDTLFHVINIYLVSFLVGMVMCFGAEESSAVQSSVRCLGCKKSGRCFPWLDRITWKGVSYR